MAWCDEGRSPHSQAPCCTVDVVDDYDYTGGQAGATQKMSKVAGVIRRTAISASVNTEVAYCQVLKRD